MSSPRPDRDPPDRSPPNRSSTGNRLRRFWPFRPKLPLVPVLRLSGTIGTGGPLRQSLSIAKTADAIERAFELKGAVAVALVINSPGGTPAQAHLIMRRIRALAAEKQLTVLAFVEDVAASGGYMLACAADEIFGDPSSVIGSIGVISASFGFDRLIERFGIERRIHTSGRSKSILDPFRPENPEDVERLKSLQEEIHQVFIELVRERRGARLNGPEAELFSGAFWTAGRALGYGLIDGIGDLRSTLRARFGDNVRLKPVGLQRGLIPWRFGTVAGEAAWSERLADEVADGALAALERRALWWRVGL